MAKQRRIFGLVALALAMMVAMLDSSIMNIALPDIMTSFKSNLNDASWISMIYILGLGIFIITASKLADQFGRKKLMIIGLLLFGVISALRGLSNSLMFLIIMRFIQSIGGAIIMPICLLMGLALFGKEKKLELTSLPIFGPVCGTL
jgi:MFS family permease